MERYMFTYFESVDILKMYTDDILGIMNMDQIIFAWAFDNNIDYNIFKIHYPVPRQVGVNLHPMIGYRLLDTDAILFKMDFSFAKFEEITHNYDEILSLENYTIT